MKILVLGGTGAIGSYLIKLLSLNGHQVVVTSRSSRETEDSNVTFVKGNAKDLDFLHELLKNKWDAIVDFMSYKTAEFQTNITCLLQSTEQYLFLSSARVFADTCGEAIKESSLRLLDSTHDADYLSTDEYALAKARQENILKTSTYKNWTILRPYITYGTYRLQLGVLEKEEWLYRILHGRTAVFSEDIARQFTTMTYGMNVSQCICRLIGHQKTLCEDFNLTTSYKLKWEDIVRIYKKVIEQKIGRVPKFKMVDLEHFLKFRPGMAK